MIRFSSGRSLHRDRLQLPNSWTGAGGRSILVSSNGDDTHALSELTPQGGRSFHRDRQVKLTYNTQYNTCSQRLLYREGGRSTETGRLNSPTRHSTTPVISGSSTGRSLHRDRQVKLSYNTQYNTCSQRLLHREGGRSTETGRLNSPTRHSTTPVIAAPLQGGRSIKGGSCRLYVSSTVQDGLFSLISKYEPTDLLTTSMAGRSLYPLTLSSVTVIN